MGQRPRCGRLQLRNGRHLSPRCRDWPRQTAGAINPIDVYQIDVDSVNLQHNCSGCDDSVQRTTDTHHEHQGHIWDGSSQQQGTTNFMTTTTGGTSISNAFRASHPDRRLSVCHVSASVASGDATLKRPRSTRLVDVDVSVVIIL